MHVMSAKDILTKPETTHVLIGNEKVIEFSVEGLRMVKRTIDLCGEYTMPAVIVTSELWSSYNALYKNGVKIALDSVEDDILLLFLYKRFNRRISITHK